MEQGLIALLLTIAIILAAVKTRRCVMCMLTGSLIAAIFAYKDQFLAKWCLSLQNMLIENVWVILVCLLFGALITLLTASRGSFGFSKYLSQFCKTPKRTLLVSFVMGIIIFVDDYLNVLSIGTCMKRVSDECKLPRESLAYILDSTGAPVCVLLPVSTWAIFYANLFIQQDSVKALGTGSALQAYCKAIPFCFYPIITLIIVFLFAIGWMPKLGKMKKAYQRVEATGKVYSDLSEKYNHEITISAEEDGDIWNFLIPMGILIVLAIATGDILSAVVVSLFVCFLLYIPRGYMTLDDFSNHAIQGFANMLPTLQLLLVSFVLKDITANLGLTEYIIDVAEPLLFPSMFPATVFLLGAVLAFTTGSDWGMSSIITPFVFPLGAIIGANPILIMAAIISGGTFGSHACFYADATLLASQSSGIDSMEHALSQLPYVIISCVLSVICFLIAGYIL